MRPFRPLLVSGIAFLFSLPLPGFALDLMDLETLINERFSDLPLTPDNRHRLAAWSELKGNFSTSSNTLTLHFGDIGKLEVYPENFLLRVGNRRVYHLDRRRMNQRDVAIMNETLRDIFEQISLLANHDANPDLVYFVDEQLAKKNIEPFSKLYLRHILIKFGQFDPQRRVVQFKTDWLPVRSFEYEMPGEFGTQLVKKPIDPLHIRLDEATVRGYYLRSGGTVYVEDVERNVFYATGQGYSPNVSAFKIFLQQLFTQTTTYVVKQEEARIIEYKKRQAELQRQQSTPAPQMANASARSMFARGSSRGQEPLTETTDSAPAVKPLYAPDEWMGKMLGLLRLQNAVTDPDVAEFLTSQPFFPALYNMLSAEEKSYYDRLSGVN